MAEIRRSVGCKQQPRSFFSAAKEIIYATCSRFNCTDIAKIIRKRSKPNKHEHENGKSAQEPGIRVLSYELAKLDIIKLSHWSSRDKGMARGVKETHKEWKFYAKSFAKEAQCMRTRNSNFPNNSNVTIPRRRNKGRAPNIVEPELHTIVAPIEERTMEELLRVPTEGYGEAIVLPEINADHFEIKTNLLQLVQANPFHGLENENPHAHINSFKMNDTSTLRYIMYQTMLITANDVSHIHSRGQLKLVYEKEPPIRSEL
ncbi:hypothetical protein Tco_1502876 [Tanacetum coccineum]